MSPGSKTTAAVVALLVAVGAVVAIVATRSSAPSTTSSSTYPNGISLRVLTNGTTIQEGENLAVTATIFNSLDETNTIPVGYHWIFPGVQMLSQSWPACYYYSPLELIVLKGNFSSAQIMKMGPGIIPSVFCFEYQNYTVFSFAPSSDLVNVTARYSVDSQLYTWPANATITITTNGYWNNGTLPAYLDSYYADDNGLLQAPNAFSPGVYTIAVTDEWGQLAITQVLVE